MAIIQYARRNSGSETALKVLTVNTDNIQLHNGKILISQVSDGLSHCIKLSLFVRSTHLPQHRVIGERNVWLRDVDEGVMMACAHEREANACMQRLVKTGSWEEAFPDDHRQIFKLKHLDRASACIRNFLLLGTLPSVPLTEEQKDFIDRVLDGSVVDIIATLDHELVDLFEM